MLAGRNLSSTPERERKDSQQSLCLTVGNLSRAERERERDDQVRSLSLSLREEKLLLPEASKVLELFPLAGLGERATLT